MGNEAVTLHKVIPRVEKSASDGLTPEEAADRLHNGYANAAPTPPTKTVGQIISSNVFTYFNLIFFVLALCVTLVGSYNDLTFLPVIIANILIGIIQELRSKSMMDKLSFTTSQKAQVIRGGQELTVNAEETVLDDIGVFRTGVQIYADAIVLTGECKVNEALITGEADEITKLPGDTLLSGSFVVNGECRARLDRVGSDSFVSQLTLEAKKHGKRKQSEMMRSLTRLVQVIGIAIIPVGIAMFLQHTQVLDGTVKSGVVSTVAALIGMIPEGLYLLTSVALTVGIIRLAKRRTLVHEMGCIETLARVDTLCVDKTGTITENKMTVRDIVPLCPDRFNEADIRMIMSDYVGNMGAENDTMAALAKYFDGEVHQRAVATMPFSSAKKYGGVSFHEDETYLLGAPEIIMGARFGEIEKTVNEYSAQGCRVLLLCLYGGELSHDGIDGELMPLSLILLSNKIREEAPATFEFFAKQGVTIKVISGDNPVTVSSVAVEAGIRDAEKYIDATTLNTERKVRRAVRDYTVFGRVTPDQKRRLVRALKADGHTVAMTGDGVNDVLALKDADCGVAMASGSDVACRVAQIVLLDSNFAAMPSVVLEGRRVINNIERSASLFLVKNIFSFLMALITLCFALVYPLSPSQLSLVNISTIGIPSFILALEPNFSMVRGKFLRNVLLNAFPAGLTDLAVILSAVLLLPKLGLTSSEISTMVTVLMGLVGFMMLIKTSLPFNAIRRALLILMLILFFGGALVMPRLFSLSPLSWKCIGLTAAFTVCAVPIMLLLSALSAKLKSIQPHKSRKKKTVKYDEYGMPVRK